MVLYAQICPDNFVLSDQRVFFSFSLRSSPHVQLQYVVWISFVVLEHWHLLLWIFLCLCPSTSSQGFFAVVLGLVCTFHAEVHSSVRGGRCFRTFVFWQLHSPMTFILLYYCVYRWTIIPSGVWKLFSEDKPDFWRSWLFSFPWCQEALTLDVGL